VSKQPIHEPPTATATPPLSRSQESGAAGAGSSFFGRIPWPVYLIAVLAALFHMSIFWHAQAETPDGWEFTGNLSNSPDYMQYRVWMRQTQHSGPIVENRLTPEANAPHLPVFFYWTLGRTAELTGAPPEFVFEYAGAVLAALFVVLLFLTVRLFMRRARDTWWVFLVILLGGGLTAHLKYLTRSGGTGLATLNRIINPVNDYLTFEAMRFAYVFKTLLDTHFLVVYLSTTATLVAFYFAVTRKTGRSYWLTAGLAVITTALHLYEGILLAAIAFMVVMLLYAKERATLPESLRLFASCGGAAGLTLALLLLMQRSSGIPITTWSAPDIMFSNVMLGHPVGWLVLIVGFPAMWAAADERHLVLLGWLGGCLILLLSSPYFPFADRGATTLQIPLYLLAGLIFFRRYRRVPLVAAVLLVAVLGASLPFTAWGHWRDTSFSAERPSMHLDAEHRKTLSILRSQASESDVLLAEYFDYRWLVPYFPGRGYHPHFFLTVDFERRSRLADAFFTELGPDDRAAFLAESGIDFVWVDRDDYDPEEIARTPGLVALDRGSHGALFRFEPARAARDSHPAEASSRPAVLP
jgi:hypothetical protein